MLCVIFFSDLYDDELHENIDKFCIEYTNFNNINDPFDIHEYIWSSKYIGYLSLSILPSSIDPYCDNNRVGELQPRTEAIGEILYVPIFVLNFYLILLT